MPRIISRVKHLVGERRDSSSEARPDDTPEDAVDVRTDGGAVAAEASGSSVLHGVKTRYRQSEFLHSLPFWGPWFAVAAFFVYGAISWNLAISLTDYEGFGAVDYSSLDLSMYVQAVGSQAFRTALQNTFVLLVVFTIACLSLGLILALLLDRKVRFGGGLRNIYLLPMSLSFVVTAQFWLWMYDFDTGIVNMVLGAFGVGPFNWFGNPEIVLFAVIFALVWQFSGYTMVVYLAALRGIPDDHYEAAKVDGASTVRMYWRVIVPQLKNATISASVLLMVFALKAFDFLYALTGRYRPPNGSDILATMMVREAFRNTRWAYGASIGIMLFMLALAVIGPYLYYQHRKGIL